MWRPSRTVMTNYKFVFLTQILKNWASSLSYYEEKYTKSLPGHSFLTISKNWSTLDIETRRTVAFNTDWVKRSMPASSKIFISDFKSNKFSSYKTKYLLAPYRVMEVLVAPRKRFSTWEIQVTRQPLAQHRNRWKVRA